MNSLDSETVLYEVVINDEEQYSIWPVSRPTPPGWRGIGAPALKDECLARIETLWTDMRPRSLREHMDATAAKPSVDAPYTI